MVSSWARAIWISGMAWPKEIVAVFTIPSHFSQSGSLPAPRKAFLIGSSAWRWPQSRQLA
jgi:hypothetical protein